MNVLLITSIITIELTKIKMLIAIIGRESDK